MLNMSAEPFWGDCRIGSYMIRSKHWMPFLEWRYMVSYQEHLVWDWEIHSDDQVRYKGWSILSWWVLVPPMSDMSAEPFWGDCRIGSYMIRSKRWMPFWEWRHLVSYQVAQSGTGGHYNVTVGLVPTWSYVSACPFEHACWIGSSHVLNVSAKPFQTWMLDWFLACVEYKC